MASVRSKSLFTSKINISIRPTHSGRKKSTQGHFAPAGAIALRQNRHYLRACVVKGNFWVFIFWGRGGFPCGETRESTYNYTSCFVPGSRRWLEFSHKRPKRKVELWLKKIKNRVKSNKCEKAIFRRTLPPPWQHHPQKLVANDRSRKNFLCFVNFHSIVTSIWKSTIVHSSTVLNLNILSFCKFWIF